MSNRNVSWVLLPAALVLLISTEARGYCRQNSCQDTKRLVCEKFEEPDECVEVQDTCERDEGGCIDEGNTLHRSNTCLSFAVAKGNARQLGLNDERFLDIVTRAFERWSSVDCGGGRTPGFQIQSAGLVTASEAFFCPNPDLNLSTWFLSRTWNHDPNALGYALSSSDLGNGEVYDADVELNVRKITADFPLQGMENVLLSIAVHEAGHFLGLAHSHDEKAVMYEAYSRTELANRPLTQDDIDGICAIFPPNDAPSCPQPGVVAAGLDQRACQSAMDTMSEVNAPSEEEEEPSAAGCRVAGGVISGNVTGRPHGVGLWGVGLMAWMGLLARRRK